MFVSWLAAEDEPSIADIVAAMRAKMVVTSTKEEAWNNREELIALCDSLDAAAKRAYERINNAMYNDMTQVDLSDCERMRNVMDETIGGYHG